MTHALPTGRTGRLLALGLTLLVPAFAGFGAVAPLIDGYDTRAEALTRQAALAGRMEALLTRLPELRRQAAAVGLDKPGEPAVLASDNDSMASASLQESLQAMFAQTGIALNSVETLPGEDAGPYRRIRLRVSFNASWSGLVGVLDATGRATPVLLVDELHIQPALHRIGTAPGTFDVSYIVFGFRPGSSRVSAR